MSEVTDTEIAGLAKIQASTIIQIADKITYENPKLYIETITILLGRELARRRDSENH